MPTTVGGTAKHLHRSVHGFVSLLLTRGQHCYARRATC